MGFSFRQIFVFSTRAASIDGAAGRFKFLIGRVSLFHGYRRGAPARAFGFTATFYPTVLLLFACAIELGCQLIVA